MVSFVWSCSQYIVADNKVLYVLKPPWDPKSARNYSKSSGMYLVPQAQSCSRIYSKKPLNLRQRRRTKLPPDLEVNICLKTKTSTVADTSSQSPVVGHDFSETDEEKGVIRDGENCVVWDPDEIEAISALFRGRIPEKPVKLVRQRPLPLPLPYKLRPLGLPTPKNRERTSLSARVSSRQPSYKNPSFLIDLAREIASLPLGVKVSTILKKYTCFLRERSLSLTVRELGHMGLPGRALEVFCWVQKQPGLFPDDRVLASTVEVLARYGELKLPLELEECISIASRSVYEAMIRGFIKGGNLKVAWKLLLAAKDSQRILDASIYAKLILEMGKNPDKHMFALQLLADLGEREDLNLTQQDCTAIMKICIRLRKFEIVEGLFSWFKQSRHQLSVVMYTTLIYSRFSEMKYREAMAIIWEMEASNCLFDLPAYRVAIKLFVALNDLSRTVRYFSKLKKAGFSPTFDIYQDLIKIYTVSGRLAKCEEVFREAEMAGFKLDQRMRQQ